MFTIGVVIVTMSSSNGNIPVVFGVSSCANGKTALADAGTPMVSHPKSRSTPVRLGRGGKTVPALGGHAVAPGDERVRSRRRTRAQPLRLAARQNWHATLPYEPAAAAMESA